jgi:hypothetical protein
MIAEATTIVPNANLSGAARNLAGSSQSPTVSGKKDQNQKRPSVDLAPDFAEHRPRRSQCFSAGFQSRLPALKRVIPTYGIDLKTDADACRRMRSETASLLKIENV